MTDTTPDLAIYHEHPDWFRPLFAELERRGIAYQRIDARETALTIPLIWRRWDVFSSIG